MSLATSPQAMSSPANAAPARPWADLLIAIGVTVLAALIATQIELSEKVFVWTRTREQYELDELPVIALTFAVMMLWFARRRYREAQSALHERRLAEQRLAALLAENRRLARQTIDIQEAERRNLARELHDDMGQYLNAIKIDAVSLQRQASEKPDMQSGLAAIVRNTDHVYWVINALIRQLRPVGLDTLGLAAAIESCVDDWATRLPQIDFSLQLAGDVSGLDEQVNLTLYRAVQEGLTNVSRHAAATRVSIHLDKKVVDASQSVIELVLQNDSERLDPSSAAPAYGGDDGRNNNMRGAASMEKLERPTSAVNIGMKPEATDATLPTGATTGIGMGMGLVGMRERVDALGGTLLIDASDDAFRLVVRIPVASTITEGMQ